MRLPHDRLNGWKEIAAHLGKGVRTVQRWEHLYGLPVHRLGADVEVVFAFRSEIDAWAERRAATPGRRGEPAGRDNGSLGPPAGPAHSAAGHSAAERPQPNDDTPRRLSWALGAVALCLAGISAWVVSRPADADTSGYPTRWEFRDDALAVLNARGSTLWTKPFSSALHPQADWGHAAIEQHPVQVRDLDADGAPEVLAAPHVVDRSQAALHWFDASGRLLFTRRPLDTVHFGGEPYAPPWVPHRIWITDDADGKRAVWTSFVHGVWYPTVVEEYTSDRRLRTRHWSNGYVGTVSTTSWKRRAAVFIGASANETGGASLAILQRGGTTAAPAADPNYRCSGCATAHPTEFLLFPPSCVVARLRGTADVVRVDVDGLDRLVVSVQQMPREGAPAYQVKYTLNAALTEASIAVTREFVIEHDRLWRAGAIDHRLDDGDTARMLPVERWIQGRFVPLRSRLD